MVKDLSHNETPSNTKIIGFNKSEIFTGPIPHPEIIERYERIYPGSAKIIFDEWNIQVRHRQSIEKSIIRTDNIKSVLGLVFGFIVALVSIGGGVYSALNGMLIYGSGLSFSAVALIVGAFVTSRKRQ